MEEAPPELLSVAESWMVSALGRDADTLESLSMTPSDSTIHTVVSGLGPGLTLRELSEHLAGLAPRSASRYTSRGWVADKTAWIVGAFAIDHGRSDVAELRVTYVLALLDDGWKVAHCHLSEGVHREFDD